MDDEPLSDWAERRSAKIGRLRAVPLVSGEGPKASHLNPDAPRPSSAGTDTPGSRTGPRRLAETQRLPHPHVEEPPPVTAPRAQPMRAGRGRHRKPRPGEWLIGGGDQPTPGSGP
ncbi:DUF6087 family protein [Streptomyces sp. SID8374]|uniref:DUF6087 family protein n=1 Tax=Streptomyces sp. SID8374 TaxID=2690354 RepID=UPI001F37DF14|nr:DUF6087 family protein [Streptomyces sp. SID8374]